MELKNSKTYSNLARAFAGECMDRTRYEYIEYGARQQGYKALAEIIDKVAYNEFNHGRMLYSFIQTADQNTIDNIEVNAGYPFREKWDLTENLKLAMEDELDEAENVYPSFAKTAREEGFDDIAGLFENLIEIEKSHARLFKELYEEFKSGKVYKKQRPTVWHCDSCGYETTATTAFETCPVCQAKQGSVCLKEKSVA